MSTIVDAMTAFGERLRAERHARGWPIERLAAGSGVSRAMISKIERGESSPTAVVLGKLSAALELSVSELLAPASPGAVNLPGDRAGAEAVNLPGGHAVPGAVNLAGGQAGAGDGTRLADDQARAGGVVRRAADTPEWRDPDTGYLRRQVSTPRFPAAVTEVTLPPGARVPYPAGAYAFIAQLVWVLSGQLTLTDGPAVHALAAGDTFELGEPRPREFRNDGAGECRYLVVVTRTATP
jgi:transcriptional regulator with XRE-family HTH domain/quercetin dioxygenase-like cupin family protein